MGTLGRWGAVRVSGFGAWPMGGRISTLWGRMVLLNGRPTSGDVNCLDAWTTEKMLTAKHFRYRQCTSYIFNFTVF